MPSRNTFSEKIQQEKDSPNVKVLEGQDFDINLYAHKEKCTCGTAYMTHKKDKFICVNCFTERK